MPAVLERELRTYQERKDDLVGASAGKYVLVKDDEVVDVFDTEADAIRDGYRRFGNVPFLVKEVEALETPLCFTSNLLAL